MSVVDMKITEAHRKLAWLRAKGHTIPRAADIVGLSLSHCQALLSGVLKDLVSKYETEIDKGVDKEWYAQTALDKFRTAGSESVAHKYFVTLGQAKGFLKDDVNINLPKSNDDLKKKLEDDFGIDVDQVLKEASGK